MKFPVWRTSLDVFKFLWRERRIALRFSALPLAIYLLVAIAMQMVFSAAIFDVSKATSVGAPIFVLGLIQLVLYLPATVTWYRIVVLGRDEAQRRPLFTLKRLEWRLLLWQVIVLVVGVGILGIDGIGILLLTSSSDGPTLTDPVIIVWAIGWFIVLLLVMTRLSMLLALASLDQPVNPKAAWHMTKGITWRLLGATALVTLGALIVFLPLVLLVAGILAIAGLIVPADAISFLNFAAQSITQLAAILAIATLFGFVYVKLTERAAMETTAGEVTTEVVP